MELILLAITALFILYLSTLSWRCSLKALLFIVVIEGVLRKWVFPQGSEMIYFLKDIVLIGAYLKYFLLSKNKKYPIKLNTITLFLLLLLYWCIFQAFNPRLGSLWIGILGLKAYFLYIPIIFLLPNLFESETDLYHFLRSNLLLTIPVGFLGIIQFFSPTTSFINKYANDEVEYVAGFGGHDIARVSGTFSYLGSYSVYLLVCFGILLCLFNFEKSRKWKFVFAFQIALVFINCLMTGSRTAVFASLFFIVGFVFLELLKNFKVAFSLIKKFIFPIIIVILMLKFGLGSSFEVFKDRVDSNTDEFNSRILLFITEPIKNFQYVGFDGYGVGATHQAKRAIINLLDLPAGETIPVYYEEEPGRIMLDIGIIGFVFWYGLRILILLRLFSLYMNLDNPFLRQLALSAFLINLIQLKNHLVYNHTFATYYWFLSGFIFLFPLLEFKNKLFTYQEKN